MDLPGTSSPAFAYQLLETDRQVADPHTRCVEHGIGYCRGGPDRSDHSSSFNTASEMWIMLFDQIDVEARHIPMNWNQVVGEAIVYDTPHTGIYLDHLVERHTDAKNQSTHELAAREKPIDDTSGRIGSMNARYPDLPQFWINPRFYKDGAVSIGTERRLLGGERSAVTRAVGGTS